MAFIQQNETEGKLVEKENCFVKPEGDTLNANIFMLSAYSF